MTIMKRRPLDDGASSTDGLSSNWTNLLVALLQDRTAQVGPGQLRDFDLDASIYFNGSFTDFF